MPRRRRAARTGVVRDGFFSPTESRGRAGVRRQTIQATVGRKATDDLAGRVTDVRRPDGTERKITYNGAGETTKIEEVDGAGNYINLFKFEYDTGGRIKNEFIAPIPAPYSMPTHAMVYDADNQMTSFDGLSVVYDADGNMTLGPLNGSTRVGYTYDTRNRLRSAGGVTYAYDPDGNRVTLTQSGQTTRLVVNPNAKLTQLLVRTRADGSKTYYVYGGGLLYDVELTSAGVETGVRHSYHSDYRGSTTAISDQTGTVVERIEYSIYGRITRRTGTLVDTPFLFNGRFGVMTDPNGLYCMRARYYNPFIRRFLNPDPSGFSGGLNFYAYANGNPISYLDPFGLAAWYDTWGAAVGQWVSTAQTFYNNNLPWGVAGTLNTGISIVGGVLSTPQALGHLGEGSGTFSANPSWQTAPGLFSDISVAAGTLAGGLSPVAAFNKPIGYGNVVYRYASAGEVANTGDSILNTDINGAAKPVYVTPDSPLSSAGQAQGAYQLPNTPSYIIAGDASGIDFSYQGQVAGGSGTEWITSQQIPVISVNPIGYNLQYGSAAAGLSWLGGNVSSGSSTGK